MRATHCPGHAEETRDGAGQLSPTSWCGLYSDSSEANLLSPLLGFSGHALDLALDPLAQPLCSPPVSSPPPIFKTLPSRPARRQGRCQFPWALSALTALGMVSWKLPHAHMGSSHPSCWLWSPGKPQDLCCSHIVLGESNLTKGSMIIPLTTRLLPTSNVGVPTWPWESRTPPKEVAHEGRGQTGHSCKGGTCT